MQPSRFLANGKPLSPNHHQFLAYCSSIEPQDLKIQKKAKRSEIKRYTNSLGPPEKCSPTVNSLLEENKTNAENTIKTKAEMTNSFQDKLWNWEMVSSQQSEVPPTFLLANGRRRVFHLEEQGNMGLNPEKSKKKVEVMEVLTLPSQQRSLTPQTSLHDIQTLDKPTIQSKPTEITSQPVRDSKLTNKAPGKILSSHRSEGMALFVQFRACYFGGFIGLDLPQTLMQGFRLICQFAISRKVFILELHWEGRSV